MNFYDQQQNYNFNNQQTTDKSGVANKNAVFPLVTGTTTGPIQHNNLTGYNTYQSTPKNSNNFLSVTPMFNNNQQQNQQPPHFSANNAAAPQIQNIPIQPQIIQTPQNQLQPTQFSTNFQLPMTQSTFPNIYPTNPATTQFNSNFNLKPISDIVKTGPPQVEAQTDLQKSDKITESEEADDDEEKSVNEDGTPHSVEK